MHRGEKKKDLPCGSAVKNPLGMQEMQIGVLGWQDPLEKEMETCFSIFAEKIPWTE